MPLTIHGDNTAPLILVRDSKAEKPRTLRVKFLSKRQMRAWQKSIDAAKVVTDIDARDAAYDAALAEVVTGWENIEGPFNVAGISDAYTLSEFIEILDLIPMAMVPGVEDLKK